MPTHLPFAPSADVVPNASSADCNSDHSLAGAWLWTEWVVAYLKYLEWGCPKDPHHYLAMMGSWSVSPAQERSVRGIFEGFLELVRVVDVQVGWSRCCKSLKPKIDTFNDCSVFPGSSQKYDSFFFAQEGQPDRISLPNTTAITDLSL